MAEPAEELQYGAPRGFHVLLDRPHHDNLNGTWRFKPDPQGVGEAEGWPAQEIKDRTCTVPSTWEMAFEDMRQYHGAVWYEREFTASSKLKGQRLVLVFAAVHYEPKVWVNGELAGDAEGGLLPCAVDITRFVKYDVPNRLTVRVATPAEINDRLPHLQQAQNFRVSGIWRNVWIEGTGQNYISDIHIVPDIDQGEAQMKVEVTPAAEHEDLSLKVAVDVQGADGRKFTAEQAFTVAKGDGKSVVPITVKIDKPELWSPEKPNLYEVRARIMNGDQVEDAAATSFGMRQIEIKGTQFLLNHKPIFFRGALALSDAPDRNQYRAKYHFITDDEIRQELELAKSLGYNLLRIPIHIEDTRYYDWADKLGLFLYNEPVACNGDSPLLAKRMLQALEGMIRLYRNRPSQLFWGYFNEAGVLEGRPEEVVRQRVRDADAIVARLDGTRPVSGNSGTWRIYFPYFNQSFLRHDFDDEHMYMYDGPEAHIISRDEYPDMYTSYANLRATDRPLLFTELGGYLFMENAEKIRQANGGKMPWTIERPQPLNDGLISLPQGYEDRFMHWGLDQVFGDMGKMVERSDAAVFENMIKYDIEQIRKNPEISGYVMSQWNNFGPVPHGVVDFYNQPRAFAGDLARLQTPDLIIIDWKEVNFWSGEPCAARLIVSHYGNEPIRNATARWRLEGFDIKGEITSVTLTAAGAEAIGKLEFATPAVDKAVKARLVAELLAGDKVISSNDQNIYIYPVKDKKPATARKFNEYLTTAETLAGSGYETVRGIDARLTVTVTNVFDQKVDDFLSSGGTVLLLVKNNDTLKNKNLGIRAGKGGFSWFGGGLHFYRYINPTFGLFGRIPYDNPTTWPFYKLVSRQVIGGLPTGCKEDVLMGGYGTWLHTDCKESMARKGPMEEIVGVTVQFKYKQGRLVMTTMDRLGYSLADPVAMIMLQDLVEYCFGPFQPKTELPLKR